MRFEQIQPFLLAGMQARRTSWGKSARIKYPGLGELPDTRFVQLVSAFGVKNWEPWHEDFAATDWEILGYTIPKDLRKRFGYLAKIAKEIPETPDAAETDTTEGLP